MNDGLYLDGSGRVRVRVSLSYDTTRKKDVPHNGRFYRSLGGHIDLGYHILKTKKFQLLVTEGK